MFALSGGASPPLSTTPPHFVPLFISVVSPSLLSFLSSAPVFSTGGAGTGIGLFTCYTGPTSHGTQQSYLNRGAPLFSVILATPLANLGPSRTAPLVLSSALPPILGKVVEAIQAGHFVDFKDLLPDYMALKQRVVDAGILGSSVNQSLRLREVTDVETWLHCFLAFVAAKVESPETRELMAYGQIILMLARKHGGKGWKAYDTLFRQLVGAGHPLPWTELNPSMMAADVLQSGGQVCAFCQSHDHRKEDCALAPPSSGNDRRLRPYRLTEEVCHQFNRPAGCTTSRCRFDHKCWSCGASGCRSLKPEVGKPCPPPGPAPRKD